VLINLLIETDLGALFASEDLFCDAQIFCSELKLFDLGRPLWLQFLCQKSVQRLHHLILSLAWEADCDFVAAEGSDKTKQRVFILLTIKDQGLQLFNLSKIICTLQPTYSLGVVDHLDFLEQGVF